jgi:hypothetical protein
MLINITETQWGFSGISTFAHLPHVRCLTAQDVEFDIGIIGVPFDTAVSYRPGEFCLCFCFCSGFHVCVILRVVVAVVVEFYGGL